MDSNYDVSIIIACYNEEPLLESSMMKIFETMDRTRWSYEIIFVDDASLDNTRNIILQIIENRPSQNFQSIFHKENTGRGKTVTDGFYSAKGKFIGFLDIDLEVGPHYIPRMILALENGADVASAIRIYKVKLRVLNRIILSVGYRFLVRTVLNLPFSDTEAGFKFFNCEKILPVLSQTENTGWFWDTEIIARAYIANLHIVELPCLFIHRFDKKSSVKPFRDSLDYLKNLIQFNRVFRALHLEH